MKVILNHTVPFALAHGGVTNIVHRTRDVLLEAGVEVEYLRWWDEHQKGDILFNFGRPSLYIVNFAKSAGYRVVAEHVMTGLVSRPLWKRRIQRVVIGTMRKYLPQYISDIFSWDVFKVMDMNFFPSEWDLSVAKHMFDVPDEKSCVLPYGVNDAFLNSAYRTREDYLVCTGTITPRKRILELAKACDLAKVPLKIVGKAYAKSDEYYERFNSIVTKSDYIEHVQHISDQEALADIYRRARGFVLISSMETISQSAIEAAACETPLLLSDQDWAHRGFADNASYCPITDNVAVTAEHIRRFYDGAGSVKIAWRPVSWSESRKNLADILAGILKTKDDFRLGMRPV